MTEEVPDRNALARQLADLRDEMTSLRQELADAQETAVRWSRWAEEHADKNSPDYEHDIYDSMLGQANLLFDKVKDHWYDVGYANALRELRSHLSDAIADWAEKQGVDIRG